MAVVAWTPLLLLAACTQTDVPGMKDGDAMSVSLQISAVEMQAGSAETRAGSAETRAASTTLTAGSIGVFREAVTFADGTTTRAAQTNVEYTYASPAWTLAAGQTAIDLIPAPAKVYAYYPHKTGNGNITIANDGTSTIPVTSGKYEGVIDADGATTTSDPADICISGTQTASSNNASVNFQLTHALALLKIGLTRATETDATPPECKVTKISLKNSNLSNTANLRISDGTFSGRNATTTAVGWPLTGVSLAKGAATQYIYARIIPNNLTGGIEITLTVEGKEMKVNAPVFNALPGKIYTLQIVVHNTKLSFNSSVEVKEWTDYTNKLEGDLDYES